MKAFDYALAGNREAALEAAAEGWTIKAGGIDLLDHLKERIGEASRVVGIHGAEELRGISLAGDTLTVLPLTTLRELAEHEGVQTRFPALAQAALDTATPQIRARATVGGNICQRPRCWYYRSVHHDCLKKGGATCYAVEGENANHAIMGGGPCHIVHPSNVAPPLVAAGAEFLIERRDAERTVAAEEFFVSPEQNVRAENILEPGEVITAIRIPALPSKSGYVEVRHKQSFDWPMAACAVAKSEEGWRVVLGAVAPIPWRSAAAEGAIGGAETITPALAEAAADAAIAEAEPMSQNAWRIKIARAVVRRALLRAEGIEEV